MITTPAPRRAQPAADPAPAVSPSLLMPRDRIARAPLARWATQLRAQLAAARAGALSPAELSEEVAVVGNNTSLMATHRADAARARALCEGQARWMAALARRTGIAGIAARVVQPWVNLGRLEAMTGQADAALARFAPLAQLAAGRPAAVAGAWVDPREWRVIARSQAEFRRLMETMWAVDSLRALVQARRVEEVEALAATLAMRSHPALALTAAEASAAAWARAGDPARAGEAAARGSAACRGWDRAIFELRRGEAAACAGDRAAAAAHLRPLATAIGGLRPERLAELHPLHVAARVAGACHEAGLHAEALALARQVAAAARAANEEVFELEMLRMVAVLAAGREAARARVAAGAIEAATAYARYQAPGAAGTVPLAVEALFREVAATFAEAEGELSLQDLEAAAGGHPQP